MLVVATAWTALSSVGTFLTALVGLAALIWSVIHSKERDDDSVDKGDVEKVLEMMKMLKDADESPKP